MAQDGGGHDKDLSTKQSQKKNRTKGKELKTSLSTQKRYLIKAFEDGDKLP